MRASAYIGRVGRLAAMLGIGTAIMLGGAATAWATPGEPSPTRDSAAGTTSTGSRASITASTSGRHPGATSNLRGQASPSAAAGLRNNSKVTLGADSQPPQLPDSLGALTAPPTATTETSAKPAAVGRDIDYSISGSLLNANPQKTSASDIQLIELTGARRRSFRKDAAEASAMKVAEIVGGATISSLLFNQTPSITTTQLGQTANGIVSGAIYAEDIDGDSLNVIYSNGSNGSVVINYDGSYTYTPYTSSSSTGLVDSFQLTITDGGSGFHIHGIGGLLNLLTIGLLGSSGHEVTTSVQVHVTPFKPNSSPTATATIRSTDPLTGVVTGKISATDPDGDSLSYSPSVLTAKGTVIVANDGTFTYTPTASARHGAASTFSSLGRTDTFNISVYDGFGGVAAVPVTVSISPTNTAPVAGSLLVGKPNGTTGVVVGSVFATDADGDPLSYTGSVTTSSGNVNVSTNGGFTYTPTTTARTAANATTIDSFTVSASDGYGGVVAIPVTVRILPLPVVAQGIPNITTGVVTGTITAPNYTGTALTYAATAPSKGALSFDSTTGSFTYTPTLTARHNAAATNATSSDKIDGFTVTISDSQGDAVYVVPISVTLRPQNTAPTGSFRSGSLDPNTGVITGAVLGFDADTDSLTFSGSAATTGGRVVIDSITGTFTYTPVRRVATVTSIISGFNSPAGVVISPSGSLAYVTNSKGNSVSVVDTATRTIVATITGITTPTTMALTPSGGQLYVVGKNSVSVINTATNAVIGTIAGLYSPAGSSPTPKGIAVSPDGTLAYVINSTSAFSVVDTATNTVVKTILLPTSYAWESVAFSPDGKRAYIGSTSVYTSRWIDTATDQTVSPGLGTGSRGVFNPVGDRFYALTSTGVRAYDANGKALNSAATPTTADTFAVGRDGSILYGLGTKGEVFLFEAATMTALGTAKYTCAGCSTSPTAGTIYPNGLAVSPDGTFVYGVNPVNGTISVVTGWVGPISDSFDVTLNDGHGGTATVPVTVNFVT